MKMRRYFKNLKFRYKLLVTFVLIGIIPINFIGILWFSNTKRIMLEQEKNNINNYLGIAVSNMDNQLRIYDNLSDYLSFNQTISNVIGHKYNSYYDMYTQFTTVLDPMLSSLKYFHNDINQVTIYSINDIVKHDNTLAPISEIENRSWYPMLKDNSDIHWIISKENHSALSVRNMPTFEMNSNYGILYIDIDYSKLFESFSTMNDSNYGIFIVNKDGENIFEFCQFENKNIDMKLTFDQFQKLRNQSKQNLYTIVESKSRNEEWTAILYKPQTLIYKSVNSMFIRTIIIIFIIIVIATIFATILSKLLVSDLEKLRTNMEEVEKGNMDIIVNSDSTDEIGTLVRGFRNMLSQIKTLIEDVYESRLIQKDYEMRALQAQINPHFLYNTLSLINWMALEAHQENISKITLSLSTFYRTALNKGKNILLVRDELNNMKSYLDIQLMMHDYNFDVVMDIDEDILNYKILNLLLQPLIENAIDHGIDLKNEGKGRITIVGKKDNNDLLLIVEDNGVGMEEDKIQTILTNQSKGYGVRNVNERIKLYYGVDYNLKIESILGKGTRITVRIPLNE